MPDVPGPEHGEDWVVPTGSRGLMSQEFERRDVTKGVGGAVAAGRAFAWVRHRSGPIVTDAAWLSIVADWALHGVVLAIGHQVLPSSLDNTVRQVRSAATEWLLLDIDAHAVHDGLGHCTTRIFAEDGTLVGLASQTGTMRPMPATG
jgi:acyl-CoA thioesterase